MMNKKEYKEQLSVLNNRVVEQAEIIRKLNVEIDNAKFRNATLHESCGELRAMIAFLRGCLAKTMTRISLDVVLQKTHRERNEGHRLSVREIWSWLHEVTQDNLPSQDMDDIPF